MADNLPSSDSLENVVQAFIELLDDFKNSDADPEKIDTFRTSISMERRRLHEFDSKVSSTMYRMILNLLESLGNTMDWIGNKETKSLGERSRGHNDEVKSDRNEQSDSSLLQVYDNDSDDVEQYNGNTVATRDEKKNRIRRRKKDSPKEFQCQECEKRFTSKKHLQNHCRVHTAKEALDSGRFKCELCEKCFRTKQNLSVHKITHKEDEAARKHNRCNICGNLFTQFSHLKEHKRIHLEDETARKPHACDTCGKRFTQSSHLREHKKTHLQDETARKPHVCDICERRFSQAAHLRNHKSTHMGQQ